MSVDPAKWFGRDPESVGSWQSDRGFKPCLGNRLTYFINIEDYFADVAKEIRAVRKDLGDFVYLTAWNIELDTPVDPPGGRRQTLLEVLNDAAAKNAQIRFLLNDLPNHAASTAAIQQLSGLKQFHGMIDEVHQLTGSQHDKLIIIRNAGGVIAYCTSADFEKGRLGRLANPSVKAKTGPEASSPFHEAGVRLSGPAVCDLWNHFCQRFAAASQPWLPAVRRTVGSIVGPTLLLSSFEPPVADLFRPAGGYAAGGVAAQIVRTLPNKQTTRNTNFNFLHKTGYGFAPGGDKSYYDIVAGAIRKTSRYLYVEDQYLFFSADAERALSLARVLAELIAKDSFKKLIILIAGTGTIQKESCQAGSRRAEFIKLLGPARNRKVEVYTYSDNLGSPYWVHAKLWIFDDEFAVVGSANVDRRSYTCNTESGVAFCDTEIADDRNLVKRLRVDLWEKHLNGQPLDENQNPVKTAKLVSDKQSLLDFASAAGLWARAPLLKRVDLEASPSADLDFIDTHRSEIVGDSWLSKVVTQFGERYLHGRDKQWDIIIDPDGS